MHANCARTAPKHKGSHRTQFPLILPGDLFSLHPTAACRSPPFHLWHIHQPWISVQYFDHTDENHNPGVQNHNFKKGKKQSSGAQTPRSCCCIPVEDRQMWTLFLNPEAALLSVGWTQAGAEQSRLARMPEGESWALPFYCLFLTSFSFPVVPPCCWLKNSPCNRLHVNSNLVTSTWKTSGHMIFILL